MKKSPNVLLPKSNYPWQNQKFLDDYYEHGFPEEEERRRVAEKRKKSNEGETKNRIFNNKK